MQAKEWTRNIAGAATLALLGVAAATASTMPDIAREPAENGPGTSAMVDVIPEPARVVRHPGVFSVRADTKIIESRDMRIRRIARYFADLLQHTSDMKITGLERNTHDQTNAIVFKLTKRSVGSSPEAYAIDVSPHRVMLTAGSQRGLFYAAVTLWQLCTMDLAQGGPVDVPALTLSDSPRFAWRGLLLDSARHYQSPDFILRLLDWMALHKLNILHWHLTDDQAWRLQIRKYPRLTEVGAWRVPAGAGAANDVDPETGRPRLYGGFYTQETVRRIVAHAAERNVTIVPEIDMPGHATAAIVAYPVLGTVTPAPTAVPSDWGVYANLFNVEDGTFGFLEDVLTEVFELFPGKYVHLGGDEAVKEQWQASARVQARMHELRVADEQALQHYFMRRMGNFLTAHGRRLIGWDEILQGGSAPDATIMSWQGTAGAEAAAKADHDTVLSPSPILYFDNRQGNFPGEPPGRGLLVSLEEVYRFNPLPAALPASRRHHVLGLQANIWTEHIRTEERVQYMTFPRAAAVAEIGWSAPASVSWESFLARLPAQMARYRAVGVRASTDAFEVDIAPRLQPRESQVQLTLANQAGTGEIHYSLNGEDPDVSAPRYAEPFTLPVGGEIRAATFLRGQRLSGVSRRALGLSALQTRSSHELRSCTQKVLLALEDDAPLNGPRAVFLVDIMNPCWIYEHADLTRVTAISAAVGQVPFNFQLGAEVHSIELSPPHTSAGELEVRVDGCKADPVVALPLAPAVTNDAVTTLPPAGFGPIVGVHDLCFNFTRRALDPMWVVDSVQLLE